MTPEERSSPSTNPLGRPANDERASLRVYDRGPVPETAPARPSDSAASRADPNARPPNPVVEMRPMAPVELVGVRGTQHDLDRLGGLPVLLPGSTERGVEGDES